MNRLLHDFLWTGFLLVTLSAGGSLRTLASSELSGPPGSFQLNAAAALGDIAELKALLGSGLPADAAMADTGMTPLMVAADAQVAHVLIQAGADVNQADAQGWTALHHAVTRPHAATLVAELLKAGADASARNDHGETPLLLARLQFTEAIDPAGGAMVLTQLVNQGKADINAWDRDGWTLLHQAASNDEPALASACLALGADPVINSPLGETPIALAQRLRAKGFLTALRAFHSGKEQ